MAAVTICIEPGELQSLRALAELDAVANGRQPDVPGMAAALMRRALAASLRERGLAPPAAPEAGRSIAATSAEPDSAVAATRTRDRTRKYAASALAAAVLILLWGGYARGWGWTGFRANGQLWDWMSLLLLPAALVIAPMLPKYVRSGLPGQKWVIVILILGWTVTIIGGYTLSWKWTGYPGNTLWDWLRLLLLPLIVPTLLIPALFSRISGPGTQPDQEAKAGALSLRDRPGLTVPASATGSQS